MILFTKFTARALLAAATAGVVVAAAAATVSADSETTVAPTFKPYPSVLKWVAAGGPKDPIEAIDVHMGDIVGDLGDGNTEQPVQEKQKHVVGEFDALIKQLEQQCKSGGSGANPNPTKPMTKSQLAKGPGGSGPLHDPLAGTKTFATLPPKDRDQVLQSRTEGFPPGFESVLASYYARLAAEQVNNGETVDKTPAPTTRPTVR